MEERFSLSDLSTLSKDGNNLPNSLMISPVGFRSWLLGLIQRWAPGGPRRSATQMWDDVKRTCKGIFRPARFPCDTFTAEDLKSDNMREPQRAEESDSNTWSHRRHRPINAKKPSKCSPVYNPTAYFMGYAPPVLLMCGSLITFHIKRLSLATKRSVPKLRAMCVKYSSSTASKQLKLSMINYQERRWLKCVKGVL